MPTWTAPSNQTILPSDSEMRTLAKWCQTLFEANPALSSQFPEGNRPTPGDDEERLLKKINALLSA